MLAYKEDGIEDAILGDKPVRDGGRNLRPDVSSGIRLRFPSDWPFIEQLSTSNNSKATAALTDAWAFARMKAA